MGGNPHPDPALVFSDATPGTSAGSRFLAELERHTTQTRELFLKVLERERA